MDLYLTRWQKAYTEALHHMDSASALQETIRETGESLYDVFSMIITAMRLFCFIGFQGNDVSLFGLFEYTKMLT